MRALPSRFTCVGFSMVTATLISPSTADAQRCSGARADRSLVIVGSYVAAEAAVIAARHDEWWITPTTDFYFTWDESANKAQDRLLHAELGYQVSQLGALAFDWACFSRTTAGWLGAALGFAIGLPKEIGDGFHEGRGFSVPDMLWSAGGALLPAVHRAWAPSTAIVLKANYWPSDEYRDRTGVEPRLTTDYAGQRYFLAVNPGLLPSRGGAWPDWLGVAVGHSVTHWIPPPPPIHQWYVTLDINARGVPIEGEWWRTFAALLDQIHLPAPGIRIQEGNVRFGLF